MTPAILSVQSHVAFGYVGNRAAVFPLQRMGFDVWAVNTVQFSNHTGYGAWTGEVFSAEHVRAVIDGVLKCGGVAACRAVLSGYMGDVGLGEAVLGAAGRVRRANPAALYVCDPVMGDDGRGVFVRDGLPDFFRQHAIPTADIVTPNRFELELLTGLPARSLPELLDAAAALRRMGPGIVLVTSVALSEGRIGMLAATEAGAWLVETPLLPLDPAPNGAGDAVAALFLGAWLHSHAVPAALEHAAGAIHAVLAATANAGTRELALIAAQDALVAPPARFIAHAIV